jgi:HlyD family secretion protein
VRNAPISVQNVVTYNVVVGVNNTDLRLKPGMTANVSIIVARNEQALKVANAALRFSPARAERADAGPPGGDHAVPASQTPRPATGRQDQAGGAKQVWKVSPSGDPEAVSIEPGISDGNWTEVLNGNLQVGDEVIIGLESPRAGRKPESLPPGFGSAQPRRSRDRGL